jgi:hypothetical protein
MKPPFLFVDLDDRSVSAHPTLDEASKMIEWEDLAAHDYAFYDSEGRRFRAEPLSEGWGPFKSQRVRLDLEDVNPTHASELRQALVEYLRYLHIAQDVLERATLAELVTLLTESTRR